ncbi:hypothetical protein [Lacisediminihabitans profunda]|uniref:hypothetical protein n=1 Tax=Lacisediminihabitans profunda TaxID=2594790 RepID=UPI001FE486AB|nr:hypothetical protein [Lacisediminihabitans profunda]
MAHGLMPALPTPVVVRYRLTPWWLRVLAVWVVSRVVTTMLMLLFASWQEKNPWTGPRPGLLAFSQLWDSVWYHIVAVSGYPSVLPRGADGHVAENAWAFLPGYPAVSRLVMTVTGLPWEPVSVFLSVAFSLGAALMAYRLFRLILPAGTSLFAVTLFCFAPLSPLYQVAYAESMHLFLLALALYLLVRRRYWLLFPVVAVMALTRPSGLAFALALGLHIVHRVVTRARDPFPLADGVLASALALFSLAMGLAWPLLAWVVTGSASAYTDTELAWRVPYIGYTELMPFAAWIQGAQFWGAQWGIGLFAVPLLFLAVGLFAVFLFIPPVRRLGVDLRFWSASYAVYLLAVFFPQSSTFRLLVPLFPLLGAVAQPRSPVYRVAIVALCIAGQVGWLYACWWVNGYDWTPP